jgi:type 1 glutamine amidotransferase
MNRREWLHTAGLAGLALGASPWLRGWAAADADRKKRILMYTRSEGFQHPCVQRKGTKLSLAEQIATDLGAKHGFEVVCEKDGRVFTSDDFPKFDGFLFESQGDLCKEKSVDGQPPMTQEGKKALLEAVHGGKGFVGCHCASDTFHSPGDRWQNQPADKIDPYIAMVGGEFAGHGAQQKAWMRATDHDFPGLKDLKDVEINEEWYSLKNFAPDLHVILVQDTKGMKNFDYQRPNYPATWARKHGKGRVFFTSMGHRDDVWQSELFQTVLLAGLAWALGNVEAEVKPNFKDVTPHAAELPKQPKKSSE